MIKYSYFLILKSMFYEVIFLSTEEIIKKLGVKFRLYIVFLLHLIIMVEFNGLKL